MVLETGEELPGVYAYVAEGGLRTDETGMPIRMQMPGTPGLTQAQVLEAPTGDDLPDNPFFELPDEMGAAPRRYGTLPPVGDVEEPRRRNPDELADEKLAWVDSSPDGLERGGKSVIRLCREDLAQLGNPPLVSIRSARLAARYGAAAPAALAAVHPYSPEDPAEPPVGHVQVDHVLRMGCGLERGDVAALRPAYVDRVRWFDWMLGRPTYLTMRVTLADPASAERDIVLMPRLAIDILGVESGDYIVMEGSPDEDGRVPSVVLKVFEVPSDVEDNRRAVTGGSWGARFPAGVETLGINQDLPMAFVDAELRARLGVNGQTLGMVRVRPGRLHRFYVELREILLVLAVALLGVVTVVNIMIGLITPPYGLLLFVMTNMAKITMRQMVVEVLPFLWAMLVALAVITLLNALWRYLDERQRAEIGRAHV